MPRRNPEKGLNVYERMILVVLDRAKRPLSQTQVSEKSGMSWKTTKDHMKELVKQGHVKCKDKGNRLMCEIKKSKKESDLADTFR